jgi:glycosidase
MKNSLFFLSIIIWFLFQGLKATSQTVYTDPELPNSEEPVTVYFNAVGTPLEGYNGDVYTHTGVTIDDVQWQYVIGIWGNNLTQPKLTKVSTNLYKLDMSPSIRNFYSVPATKDISEMCFVFRSSDAGTQSINQFVDVFSLELSIVIQNPGQSQLMTNLNDPIPVEAVSPLADSIFLYVNNTLVKSVAGITITDTILADNFGNYWDKQWVKLMAKNAGGSVADSFSYVVIPEPAVQARPAGMKDGINYLDTSTVLLSLYAPLKQFAFVIGDFNNWQWSEQSYMNRTPDGKRYWIQLNNLNPGQEYAYQYFVDGDITIGDPYCEKVLDPWNDQYINDATYPDLKPYPSGLASSIVSVFQTEQPQYNWENTSFEPPSVTDLVVYELLIRDFIAAHDYNTLIDTLTYLKRLGINAIELMPVNEFEGNLSWGYNPNFYFAPDKYYGPKNTLKAFVDACHSEGIAVVLDVVYNHSFGTSPYVMLYWDESNNRPAANSPFYNPVAKHDFNVGYDMNHESLDTKTYIGRALRFWIEEYHVDGYRFDLSKGFTQTNTLGNTSQWGHYDQSRINILNAYADTVWSANSNAYVILEHFADNDEEEVLSNDGMLLWGNSNYNYNEATMGWIANSNFDWISYQKRVWDDPHVMGYMESHDEERLMAKNLHYGNASGGYNIQDSTTALKRMELAAAFFFTIPGPKMIYEFGELGYDYWINWPGIIGEGDHRTDQKPIKWSYQDDYRRKVLFNIFSALIHLKKAEPAFETTIYTLNLNNAFKSIHLNNDDMNVTVLGNFDVSAGNITPSFQHTGYWYNYFQGDSINVTSTSSGISLQPGEYRIYTDKKLETPQIGLGTDEQNISKDHLSLIYPNPSSGEFNIRIMLDDRSDLSLEILDLDGRRIQIVVVGNFTAGDYTYTWDGSDEKGSKVPRGMYFARLSINGRTDVKKVIVK